MFLELCYVAVSRQTHEQFEHLWKIWRPKSSDRVPAGRGLETGGATIRVRTVGNVM